MSGILLMRSRPGPYWQEVRQGNRYENDMYFISQLYEEKWDPQTTMV